MTMTETDKDRLFDQAVELRNAGNFSAALPLLEKLAKEDPDSHAGVFVLLGDTHEELGDVDSAIHSFRAAIKIDPGNEHASVLLFARLWYRAEDGDVDAETEALDEIRRFVTISGTDAYADIIREISEKKHLLWPNCDEPDSS